MTEPQFKKIDSVRVKKWTYNRYKKGDVTYSDERQGQKYPMEAVIKLTDDDIQRFSPELDKCVAIRIHHRGLLHKPIDDIDVRYPIDELIFELESVD